jgi:putative DNA primase/helicase
MHDFTILTAAASSYAARGLKVFPCLPNEKRPHPALVPAADGQPGGFHLASSAPDVIAGWWQRAPQANIGLPTGQPWPDDPDLGLLVLDVDVKHRPDLRPKVEALLADLGLRLETWVARTPSGGAHVYALARKPVDIVYLEDEDGPIGELRGSGGYVLLSPSRMGELSYEWLSPLADDGLPQGRPLVVDDPLGWALSLLREFGIEAKVKGDGSRGAYHVLADRPAQVGERNIALFSYACALRRAGLDYQHILTHLREMNSDPTKVAVPLPERELERIAASACRYAAGDGHASHHADAPPLEALERQAEDTFTDAANARALAALLEDKALFVEGWGWCVRQADRWVRDPQGAITLRLAREHLPRHYLLEALATPSQARRVEMAKRAIKVQSRARLEAALHLARGDLYARADDFDADPWALNTPGGIIDLCTGQIRRRTPGDRVTKLAGASLPQDGRPWQEHAPTWASFLERVLPDPEVRAFLQRAVGYCLTGDVSEQVLFFLFGTGCNGKSSFIRTIQALLGDYAIQAAPDLFLARRGERHPTEIADVRGARFVATVEVEEGRRLAETLVKWLTGGDKLKARFMRQDFFEFEPTAKFWLVANHKPVVRGSDYAVWRRILVVPFTVTIPEEERDPRLLDKLRQELPGIMLWALEGLQQWREKGLAPPPTVRQATEEYRREMDVLGDWLAERCVADPAAVTPFRELYEDYTEWCKAQGELALGQRSFGNRLTERGYPATLMADGKTRARRGVRLRGPEDSHPPDFRSSAECALHRGLTGGHSRVPAVYASTLSAQSGKSGKADTNKQSGAAIRQAFEAEGASELLVGEGDEVAGAGPPRIREESAPPPAAGPPHPPRPCHRCQPAGMPGYHFCEKGQEVTLLRAGIDRERHVLRSRQAICFNSGLLRAIEPDYLVVSFSDGSWGWVTLRHAQKAGREGEFGAERQLAVPLAAFTWEAAQPGLAGGRL